jgi:LytTr DNA-binding domain
MAMREMSTNPDGEFRTVPGILAVGLTAGLFLGFVGPFGTYESLYTGWRLAYWVTLMLCGCLFFPVAYVVARQFLEQRGFSPWLYVPLVALVGAVPMMVVVIGVTTAMFSETMLFRFDNYTRVVGISLPMVVLQHLVTEWKKQRSMLAAAAAAPGQPAEPLAGLDVVPNVVPQPDALPQPVALAAPSVRLLARLPGRLGTDILCLQMEDHYVRVHTALGHEMLLMRMRDAIAEVDGLDGLLVHRSWWVARAAIVSSARDGKSMTLTLRNQLDVPVARDRMADLKAVLSNPR